MDLKAKKESLSNQYNDLTKSINKSLDMRSRVLGALELLHQIDNDKKMNTCEKCNCENCTCENCECTYCDCQKEKKSSDIEPKEVQPELNLN